jgi:hypothetical protein
MNLEIVPSPVYRLENGIPAYKAGEWEGIKPNHFERTRLLLKQIRNNNNPKISHRPLIHKSSSEYVFKPSKKEVKSYLENISKRRALKSGKRYIPEKSKIIPKFRYGSINPKRIRPVDNFTTGSIILPAISLKNNENSKFSRNISFSSSSEANIESMMNRKKRIYSLDQQRNYYQRVNPGDKNYRYVEHLPDFYKEGGLIVGSTNRIRITDNFNKLRNNIYQTMDLNIKSLDVSKLWKSKVKQEKENNDLEYVNKLELWEKMYVNEEETKNHDKNTGKNKEKNNGDNKNNKTIKKKVKIKK